MKKAYASKTMWVNLLAALFAIADYSQGTNFLNQYASQIAMGWGVLNMALRAITKDKIQLLP